jgi:hypothetical protein
MTAFCIAFTLAVLLASHLVDSDRPPLVCRDPDAGGTTQNKDRKFLVIGSEGSEGAGLGNLLIFFPGKTCVYMQNESYVHNVCDVFTLPCTPSI